MFEKSTLIQIHFNFRFRVVCRQLRKENIFQNEAAHFVNVRVLDQDALLAAHFLQSEQALDLSIDEWLLFLHTVFDELANAFWL